MKLTIILLGLIYLPFILLGLIYLPFVVGTTTQNDKRGHVPRFPCIQNCEQVVVQFDTGGPGIGGISFAGGDGSCTDPACDELTKCDDSFTITYVNPHGYVVEFWVKWDDQTTEKKNVAVGGTENFTSPGDGTGKYDCGDDDEMAQIILTGPGDDDVSRIDVFCDICDIGKLRRPRPNRRVLLFSTAEAAAACAAPQGILATSGLPFLR